MARMYSELFSSTADTIGVACERISSHLFKSYVHIPPTIVKPVREQVVSLYRHHVRSFGLENIVLPETFVKERYTAEVQDSVAWFLLKHLVLDYLVEELTKQKILLAHTPRLLEVIWENDNDLIYVFDISTNEIALLKDWKLFPFKAPKRKLYKDLDKQVEAFVDREHTLFKQQNMGQLGDNDWVCFQATMLNDNLEPIPIAYQRKFWMKLTTKYLTSRFQQSFVGKRPGDSFVLTYFPLDETLQETVSERNPFLIHILSVTKGSYFSLDSFKSMFRLKSKLDVHRKLIEVFSYRNDISQRKSIIEEVFHLFFSKHRFEVPKHLVLRKQEDILMSLKKVPDYYVYRSQRNFEEQVAILAERQLKEEMLVDQIAYEENVAVEDDDIKSYLNLFNTDRLKEFVHFKPYADVVEESHVPMHESMLRQVAMREKTLNHVIHVLTR